VNLLNVLEGATGVVIGLPTENSLYALSGQPNQYSYSTVTDFARFRGWSTSQPRRTAM
jgi:hypothetical protein